MKMLQSASLLLAIGSVLAGCQSSQSRQEQLAAICANPGNREPGTAYFSECQTLYPSSDQQLQKNYQLGSPTRN
ncbi:conserved exported hypothetical protein [Hyphomicrobiales bacterium]|nr:conserved exported hypothetical protein [Hyphomicrobiales bacterium]CAH1699044.1 conserved exported hypothetical protein [Hyphomicrobiales bacterium]CAI0342688.1 conserved exported hypothetical protein [Hyphomicrobiales bacterium]